jgi:hypothetical protein
MIWSITARGAQAEFKMAIDTYAKLQSEILDTLNRTDLAADVTEFSPGAIEGAVTRAIAKAERRIVRRLRTREFETSTSVTTTAGVETVALPVDYVMMKAAVLSMDPALVLAQKDLAALLSDHPSTATGLPRHYAAFGASLYLRPLPDAERAVRLFYYAQPAPLSAENVSNTLLTKYPDLMLYGALIEITAHVEDDGRIGLWKNAFDEALRDIVHDDVLNRWSGAPIRASVDARSIV